MAEHLLDHPCSARIDGQIELGGDPVDRDLAVKPAVLGSHDPVRRLYGRFCT